MIGRIRRALALLLLAGGMIGCSAGGEFPSRPITLICPWSAGGGTDRVARQIAAQLERELGVPVNVVNATGGAGVTGHTRGALARPDGYTITMITSELNMLHWRGLTNITHEDFRPLMQVNRDNAAVFVRQEAPWSSLKELEEAIRSSPGSIRGAGTAFGGVWHVSMAGWLIESGLQPDDVTWISLNGSAPSLQELMAGGVNMVTCSVPEARSLLDAGSIKCLGVMAEERLSGLPEVPTLKEQGVDWTSMTWRGLAVPRGVSDERFEVLLEAANRVVHSDEYRQFLEQAGFGAAALPPDEFRSFLQEENQNYGDIFGSEAFQAIKSQRYGPMLFPNLLFGLLGITLIALVATGKLKAPEDVRRLDKDSLLRIGLALGAVLFYLIAAEQIGYILTVAVILTFFFWYFEVRWPTAAAVVLVTAPLTYQLFAVYLRVPLPWGWLGW